MKISSANCIDCKQSALNDHTYKAKMHIIDRFMYADNIEYFTKFAFNRMGIVSDLSVHYVDFNYLDINTNQQNKEESGRINI